MTAYAVIIRERTTDPDALARYRETAPLAREKHPAAPIFFYGPYEVLEGDPAEGVAILSFPTMTAALGTRAPSTKPRFPTVNTAASPAPFSSRAPISRSIN